MGEVATPRLGVVGLGLIGSSILRALAPALDDIVVADANQATVDSALGDGLARAGVATADPTDSRLAEALADRDVVILAVPPPAIVPFARALARDDLLLSDVASVKSPIMAELSELRFVGGHPMAGSERTGYASGRATLFQNATYVLCPPPGRAAELTDDLETLSEIASRLGAHPLVASADDHDRAVAAISHLPHVVASALVRAAGEAGGPLGHRLAAGGFLDITRVAAADPALWAAICLASRPHLLPAIDEADARLRQFRVALDAGNRDTVHGLFADAARRRAAIPPGGGGALLTDSQLLVTLDDRPGTIAGVAMLLAAHDIDIRNLTVQNIRQYEGGQLRLFLADPAAANAARDTLEEAGYECER